MASVSKPNVVDIPPVTKNPPPNPLLGYNGTCTAPPSAAGSSETSAARSTLVHQVLLYDQRCIVTGAASNQLQACRLVNSIRTSEYNREGGTPSKDQVVCGPSLLTL